MAAIRLLIPNEELYNLEQISSALRELRCKEKKANKLKYVQNMLHDPETSLALLEPLTSGLAIRRLQMPTVPVLNHAVVPSLC